MANRQVFPSSLFPLRGDISAEAGATSVIVQGLQGIPIISPPVEPAGLDTLFYDSYNNDWFYASPWDIPVGTPLVWEGYGYGSSGISWIAPDTLAFGNGTDGDVSGAAAMTALVLFGSASYYGPYNDYDVDYGPSYDQFYTSVFSGATQNWNLILPPNPGAASQVLTTNGTGVTYWSTISVPALVPNKTLYVDNTRTDSFTPNGTIAFPFATITAAINQVIANGDNATYTYLIDIQPSVYAETINIGNASLYNLMFEGHGGAAAAYASSGTPMPGAIVHPASGNALQGTTNVDQIKILQFSGLTFLGPVNITDTVSNNLGANGFAFVNCCFGGNVTISAATGYVPLQFVSSAIGFGLTVAFTYCAINWITSDMNWGTMNLANTFMEVVSWALNPQNLNINAGSSVTAQDGVNIGAQTVTVASGGSLTLINAIVIANLVIDSGGTVTNYLGAIEGTITNSGTYTIAGTATNFSADIMNAGTGFRINSVATSGHYLRGNGTNFVSSAIQAGDISAPGSTGDILYNNGGVLGAALTTITAAGSITIPEGQVIEWSGGYGPYSTAAISALASDTLAIGDGSPGDVSGAAAMTALILFGSSSYYDYNLFHTTIYSGAEQNWSLILPPNPGTSGQVLTTNGSGVTYWETPSGGGGGGGSVTSFSSGNLSPLFTTSVATPTTTPALSFSLNTQSPNTVFAGPVSGGAATPTFRALVSTDIPVPGSTGDILYNNGGVLGAALTTITAAGSLTLPDTQVIKWGGSAYSGVGLSQLAADTLAVGNGTESDVSGAMAMTALILYGSSYYSAYDAYQTTILSGALQDWSLVLPETAGTAGQVLVNIGSGFTSWESLTTLGVPWSSLTNAVANLTLTNAAFTTTFNQTSNVAWLWGNTTTATSSTTNASPLHEFAANYWTGAASAQDLWTIGSSLAAGTNGASTLTFTHTGSSGTAVVSMPALKLNSGTLGSNTAFAMEFSDGLSFVSVDNGILGINCQSTFTAGLRLYNAGTQAVTLTTGSGYALLYNLPNNAQLGLIGNVINAANGPGVVIGNQNANTQAVTNTTAVGVSLGGPSQASACELTYAPTASSGTLNVGYVAAQVVTTINATGGATYTGQYTGLKIAATETALSSMTGRLIDCYAGSTGSTSEFYVTNAGLVNATSGYSSGGTAGVSAGPFAAITSIQTIGGIVTTLADVSDERLKDHSPYAGGLKEILGITPIKYTWNAEGQKITGFSEDRLFVGFRAQDIQKVIPEAITPSVSNPEYLGFDDRPITAALVNAIKELKAEIDALKART